MTLGGASPAWAQQALPYSYGFENNNLAGEGWTAANPSNLNASEFGITADAKKTGDYGFRFSSYNDKGDTEQYLISPEINAPSGVIVSFYHKASQSTETIQVGYSETTAETGSFTWGENISVSSSSFTKYEETFPAGTKYIAIKYAQSWKYRVYVDDFSFTAPPTCIKPTGLTSTDISSSSVDLSWTSTADNFQIQYKKTTDGDWTLVNEILDATTYTLSGLEPATAYQVRVRTYCSAQDQSDWSDAYSFTTDCATITIDANHSFSEDFSAGNSLPNCWAVNNENKTGGSGWTISSNMGYSGYYGDTYLILPAMQLSVASQLIFDNYFNYADDYNGTTAKSSIVISTTGTAAADFSTTLYTFAKSELPSSSGTALPKEISLAAYTGQTVYIAFKYEGNNAHAWYVDNVVVEQAPACPKPTGLTASNPTWQGATLSWTAGSDEEEWKVIYGAAGFDPASAGTTIDNVTENSYTLTGLTPETEYDVYVKAVKGTDESALSDKATFTTTERYPAPTNLAISNLTTTSATLTWNAAGESSWEVAINTTGATPATEAGTGTVVNAATYDFSELTTETTYYAFVRVKDGENFSNWSTACEFTPSAYTYLTVNDGATTNSYVPVYGYFSAASNLGGQFIIPAANLTEVQNKVIKKLTFYSNTSEYDYGEAEFDVCIKEVANATMTSSMYDWNDASWTTVYNGTLSIVGGKMTITFSSDYNYNGSNLLVGIHKTSNDKSGSNYNFAFYGTNASSGNYRSNYAPNGNRQLFQPKTTIGYQEKTGAELKVYDGETELTESPAAFDFGFVPAGTTHTFTLKNTAATSYTAVVSSANLTVDPTTAITPDADGETFTVTMPNHDINNEPVVITPEDGKGLTAFTINVSGRYRDASKIFVDFTNDAIPTAWTASKWYRSSYNGYIYDDGTTAESHAELTTSRIVSTNENLTLSAKLKTDAGILNVWWSADGTEWLDENKTELKTQLNTTEFRSVNVNVPAAAKYVKFEGYNAYIKSIYGLADAPLMKVRKTAEGANLTSGMTVDFGLTASADAETFYVVNASAGSLAGVDAVLTGTGFTLNKTNLSDDGGNFTIAVDTEVKGYREATVTVSGTNQDDFVINLKGFVSGADGKMRVDFNDNQLPANWKNADTNPWEFADGKAHTKAGNTGNSLLTTCKLTVAADEVMAIKAMGDYSYSELKVHVYQNGEEITAKKMTFDSQIQENKDNYTTLYFTGLAAGDYKLVFEGWKVYIDEIAGFQVKAAAAHEAEVADAGLTIPTTGNQYVEYTASVNVEVTGTSDEHLTVKFFIGDTQYGESVVKDVTSGNTENFEVTFTPNAAVSGDAYFTIESDDIVAFQSDKVEITINAALVLDETVDPAISSTGVKPSVVVKYNAKNGWNTICMPFALTSDILTSIFGTGWQAFEFKNYSGGILGFNSTTTFYAGYPYIVYVETAATHEDVKLFDVNVTAASAKYDEHGDATFQGIYAPIAAGSWPAGAYGVTSDGKIAPGNTSFSFMKGFRAYFTGITAGARLSFFDETTGITTVIDAKELNNDGKVYNLNGQRVENAHKGLYIVNGRKVVVK